QVSSATAATKFAARHRTNRALVGQRRTSKVSSSPTTTKPTPRAEPSRASTHSTTQMLQINNRAPQVRYRPQAWQPVEKGVRPLAFSGGLTPFSTGCWPWECTRLLKRRLAHASAEDTQASTPSQPCVWVKNHKARPAAKAPRTMGQT